MAKKKCSDQAGIVVEMLQHASDDFLGFVAHLFSECLRCPDASPEAWKKSLVTVLYKKGDCKVLDNYRPITLLPILYKLFTRVVYSRIRA
eukprot:7934815-Karenia_brevis.AAC.1